MGIRVFSVDINATVSAFNDPGDHVPGKLAAAGRGEAAAVVYVSSFLISLRVSSATPQGLIPSPACRYAPHLPPLLVHDNIG